MLFRLVSNAAIKSAGIDFIEIKLDDNISIPNAEYSGLDWYKDELILLPQYPGRLESENNGCLFSISKSDISNYIKSKSTNSIVFKKIELLSAGTENQVEGFQGYEAIAFDGEDVYLTIEAENSGEMSAFIVKGEIDTTRSLINLQENSLKEISMPVNLSNMAFESLVIINDKIVAIYEANGANINLKPLAVAFDADLQKYEILNFPNLEYRITDASRLNANTFWGINYLFEGDIDLLKPANDQFSHNSLESNSVERIITFQLEENEIKLAKEDPIIINKKREIDSRNWEGIVKYDSLGFLLITDEFPKTVLAYLPFALGKNDIFMFEENNKFGFKNALDVTVIDPKYKYAQQFTGYGIAAVVDDSGWVYIDKQGNDLIRPYVIDNGPDYFSHGLARYKSHNKIGYFNEKGEIEIEAQFDFVRSFADSLAAVCKGCNLIQKGEYTDVSGGKWGFINLQGELIFPYYYDSVSDFKDGTAKVKKNGESQVLNRKK